MKNIFKNLLVLICLLSASFGPDGGQVFASSSLPSFTAWKISSTNSSVSNLASSASFTGPSEEVSDFSSVQINFKADQNATIQEEQSNDGANWDLIDSYTVTGNTADSRSFNVMRRFFRIIVTNNGGSTTTVFRLQTVYVPVNSTIPRSLTTAGNLKVAVQEALPAGSNTIGAVTQASGPWTSNITQIGGASLALGQATMSASLPVAIASNQSAIPSSQSGTWTTGRTWALSSGTDSISASVSNFPATQAVTQSTSPWVVSGTVTANAGTNLNTSALALDTTVSGLQIGQGSTTSGQKGELTLGAVTTAAPTYTTAQSSPLSLTTAGALRVDASATTQPISGTVTANQGGTWTTGRTWTLTSGTDSTAAVQSGTWNITNISGTVSLPTGAATSALQTTGNSTLSTISGQLPSTLGAKTTANSLGVNIASDQTVPISAAALPLPTGASTSALQTTGNSSLSSIDGKLTSLGQKTTANSMPVTLASDQTGINKFLDSSGSGTISALNGTVVINTNGASMLDLSISGTWVATLNLQYDSGLGDWPLTLGKLPYPSGALAATIGSNVQLKIPCGGMKQVRLIATAFTSGTVTVTWNASAGTGLMEVFNLDASSLFATVRTQDGSGNNLTSTLVSGKQRLDVGTASETADGSAAPTNTMQIGGKDGSGNLQAILTDTSGNQAVLLKDGAGNSLTSSTILGTAANKIPLDVVSLPAGGSRYFTAFAIQQTAATAANGSVFTMRNAAASTRTATVENVYCRQGFNPTNPVVRTQQTYLFQRFSAATPTGGTALTAGQGDSSDSASQVTDIRFLDTGLTTTGVTFVANNLAIMACDATQGITCQQPQIVAPQGWKLAPGEGLAIRLGVVAVAGVSLSCTIGWREQ